MTTGTPTDNDRMTRIEGAFEQMNKRLDDIQGQNTLFRQETRAGFDSLRKDTREGLDALRKDMQAGDEALRKDMREDVVRLDEKIYRVAGRLYLMIGGIMWVTTVAGFIALYVFILTLAD